MIYNNAAGHPFAVKFAFLALAMPLIAGSAHSKTTQVGHNYHAGIPSGTAWSFDCSQQRDKTLLGNLALTQELVR